MTWSGKLHWFDIFIAERDSHPCGDCTWRILPEGPCMTCNIGESKEYVCYQWNGEVFQKSRSLKYRAKNAVKHIVVLHKLQAQSMHSKTPCFLLSRYIYFACFAF